jgi:methionyl-tRNA formyltransferase
VVTLNTLQEMDNLIFLSLKFNRIVGPAVFKSKRLYNIHFSALPAYKEMYTSALPILHGAHLSGDMLHEIDPWIDTAPIIDQAISDLPETWTARDLASQVLSLPMGPQLNLDQVQDIINALKNA